MHLELGRDKVLEPLYVVCAISNPWRYRSRYQLYDRFAHYMADSGAQLYTVEAAYGIRTHAVTTEDPRHLCLRTNHELWHKENLLNIAISRLPDDWKYVAWIDADVAFARPDWVSATLHALQHYSVVQLFSEAVDMTPQYEVAQRHLGFVKCYRDGVPFDTNYTAGYSAAAGMPVKLNPWHPGFAWAARREALDHLGGLFDTAILGAGDNHMARALIGKALYSYHQDISRGYKAAIHDWEDRAEKYIRRNVGLVDGVLIHHYHGSKSNRRYKDRWKILVEHQYDPLIHLKRDWQHLWQLCDQGDGASLGLRDDIRNYFRTRFEDGEDAVSR